jgi:glutamine amidotransferase
MRSPDVTVIDYGVGNLLSVRRALEFCGARVTVTADPAAIMAASHVVLPGVGAFANAMESLRRLNLVDVITTVARGGQALLGICLGMQLLMDESEEFTLTSGLGLIPGRVIPVPPLTASGDPQKIPHIGWNSLLPSAGGADWRGTLLEAVHPGESVYFVHSLMAVPEDGRHRIADCQYGRQPVSAVIGRDNITGCQFHPEKSGDVGLRILRRFIGA